MFRVLNPNSKECLVFCFSKNCLSPHFSTPPSKNNVSGRGDPRRGGANSRVQRSPQGRVERSGLFYLFYHTSWRLQRCRRLVCLVDGVVSSFLSSSKTSSATKKFHQQNVSFKKLTTTFFGLLFIHHQVLDFDGSNDAFRCVLFFFVFFF